MSSGCRRLEPAWVTSRQIEAARRAITNYLKRGGKVWIRIFPDKPVTQKPAETRMGSGKGNPEYWVAVVKPGRIMFEIAGVPQERAEEALRRAGNEVPDGVRSSREQVDTLGVAAAGGRSKPRRRRGMKPAEIRAMDDSQSRKQLTELHEEWRDLRFQEAVGS